MTKVAYVTARAPFGFGEEFILAELLALREAGIEVLVIPRNPSDTVVHERARDLLGNTLVIPLMSLGILMTFLRGMVFNFGGVRELVTELIFRSRNIRIAMRNLAILPKGLYVASILKKRRPDHIHAHWASTTASMAYVVAKMMGISWSFTAHRWDIREDNVLRTKCNEAVFVRTISEHGRGMVERIIREPSLMGKVRTIHMGVVVPPPGETEVRASAVFSFLCPANMVLVKGHEYLLRACRILADEGRRFRCLLAGEGPLQAELRGRAKELGVNNCVEFLGQVPHEMLLDFYRRREVSAVVLPSIVTESGEHEGIPVSLMEAMAYGIPVVSTATGGIPELIGDGCGIMIPERAPLEIAGALRDLMTNEERRRTLTESGRKKIMEEYDVRMIASTLSELMAR